VRFEETELVGDDTLKLLAHIHLAFGMSPK
jgi:hypothetical protein